VLLEEKNNVKALYRISIALNSQEHKLEAWPYIKRAYKDSPNDKAIAELYSSLKQFKDDNDKKNKKEQEKKDESKDEDTKNESKKAKILKSAFKFNKEKEPESPKHDSDQEEVKIEEEKVAPQ
jgi:hypothetical protein